MHCKFRLLTPGPTMVPQEIELKMAQHVIHHRKDEFKSIMLDVEERLKELFGTKNEVLILSSSGTGAMQAAVFNLFNRGDRVLVVEGGKFGKRWVEIAKARSLDTHVLKVEWGRAVDPENIEFILRKNRDICGVLIQASETSTGVLHPVKEVGEITRKYDVLLIVDGISAVGISPLPMDRWNIDCLITGSQKGLMLPPGLALISLSDRAWERAENIEREDFYFDLIGEREKIKKGQTLYTSPVSLIYGLYESLNIFMKNGLNEMYKKYWALTQMTRTGIEALGLECFAKENYTWGLTSVKMPEKIDVNRILKELAEKFNLYIAGGQEHLKGKIIRIGHMGYVDFGDILFALSSISCVLKFNYNLSPMYNDFLERSFLAYENATRNFEESMKNL